MAIERVEPEIDSVNPGLPGVPGGHPVASVYGGVPPYTAILAVFPWVRFTTFGLTLSTCTVTGIPAAPPPQAQSVKKATMMRNGFMVSPLQDSTLTHVSVVCLDRERDIYGGQR
jgi:hypothetical protein